MLLGTVQGQLSYAVRQHERQQPEPRQGPAPAFDCSNVVNALPISERDQVADQLEAIRSVWLRNPDEKSLRSALLDLLRRLEDRE